MRAGEGHCSVGVNASDWEGAEPNRVELGRGAVVPSHDELVDLEIAGDATSVGADEALVDLELAGVS